MLRCALSSGRWPLIRLAAVVLLVLTPAAPDAKVLGVGELDAILNATFSYGLLARTQSRDPDFIGIANGGYRPARSTGDDGTLNYDTGLVSNELRFNGDLTLALEELRSLRAGLRLLRLRDRAERSRALAISPQKPADWWEPVGRLQEYYLSARFTPWGTPVQIRVGRPGDQLGRGHVSALRNRRDQSHRLRIPLPAERFGARHLRAPGHDLGRQQRDGEHRDRGLLPVPLGGGDRPAGGLVLLRQRPVRRRRRRTSPSRARGSFSDLGTDLDAGSFPQASPASTPSFMRIPSAGRTRAARSGPVRIHRAGVASLPQRRQRAHPLHQLPQSPGPGQRDHRRPGGHRSPRPPSAASNPTPGRAEPWRSGSSRTRPPTSSPIPRTSEMLGFSFNTATPVTGNAGRRRALAPLQLAGAGPDRGRARRRALSPHGCAGPDLGRSRTGPSQIVPGIDTDAQDPARGQPRAGLRAAIVVVALIPRLRHRLGARRRSRRGAAHSTGIRGATRSSPRSPTTACSAASTSSRS